MENLKITFTTFLKVCAATPLGKIRELQAFTRPGGYDFYKILKKLAVEICSGKMSLLEAENQIARITNVAERKHTLEAIRIFYQWFVVQKLDWETPPRGVAKSTPSGIVTIRLEPEIAFKGDGAAPNVLYLWNLNKPALKSDLASEGLRLLSRDLSHASDHKFGIFDLRTNKILDESLIGVAADVRLRFDMMIIETIWEDIHDPSMKIDDVISHINSLKFPPPPPPP